jgi:hypothetical protein
MAERWDFHIDESGDFDDAFDSVVVAGLLIRDSPALQPHAIKGALKRAIPLLPWPLHATFINQPAYVAAALEPSVRANRQAEQSELGSIVIQTWSLLKDLHRDRVNAVARRLRAQEEPNYDDIAVLSLAIRSADNVAFERLRAHALETYATAARLLSDLAAGHNGVGLPAIVVAAAGETVVGDAWPEDDPRDRYLSLLGVALTRACQVLRRDVGPHVISVRASRRNVIDWRLKTSVRMNLPHLNEVIRSLGVQTPVTLVAGAVGTSWEDSGAGYVLADIAANAARQILLSRSVGIRGATAALQSRLGVAAASGTPALSHCAASGEAAELIVRAAGGALPGSPSAGLPCVPPRARWACEQAWEWAEALRQ